MMLVAGELRVALVTTHLPLQEVSKAITRDALRNTLVTRLRSAPSLRHELPRILVLGLNRTQVNQGYLGREEIEVIEPVSRNCAPRACS
jgi:4-hydroxythreonine-4-phosphate dehydrogenase